MSGYQTAFEALMGCASDSLRLRAWQAGLRVLVGEEPARPSRPNGHAKSETVSYSAPKPHRRSHKPIASGKRRGRPPKVVSPAPEPADGPLSIEERERLRFLRASNVSMPGVGPDLVERAIAGDVLVVAHQSQIRAMLIGAG